ncbi:hypothetical protein D0Y65_004359 [Glycine soja]|uniref:Uncharacterized protein n=1 Tax=Glycine soja TaxID=3848 RepID=A0A445LQX2_GLYSO|nr:hypothetical protein D0Y65_004359 [Glycine soja]
MGKSGEKPFSVVALLIDSGNNKKKFEKVKGYLTHVTLGYKIILELRKSFGDVDPLKLIEGEDVALKKAREYGDVLTGEFDKLKARDFVAEKVSNLETFDEEMVGGFIKTLGTNANDRVVGASNVDANLRGF